MSFLHESLQRTLHYSEVVPHLGDAAALAAVKAGSTGAAHVRDLRGVVEREKAAIGVRLQHGQ